MKVLKSIDEKAWFFDCKLLDEYLSVGLACFLPHCASFASIQINGRTKRVELPEAAINNSGACRILNVRLPLL